MCVWCAFMRMELSTRGANEVAQGEAQDAGTPTLFVPEANDDDPRAVAPRDGGGR